MSAVMIVEGVSEGLVLLNNLVQAAYSVNAAIQTSQSTGTPLDLTTILSAEAQAELNVLAAITAAKAAGR